MKKLSAEDFAHIDIPSTVERYTSTRLDAKRTQSVGACPYEDCMGDDDGFIVYDELSTRGCHFYCRSCRRAGDIVKLLQDILHKKFPEVCELLDIGKGKAPLNANTIQAERNRKRKEEAQKQLAILATIARASQQRGLQYERAQAYLAQRGVSLEIAMQYGLCYIPPYKTMSEELKAAWWGMRQWTDRLIFPLSDGGYTGRALFLWIPGMDENEHKKVLDCFNNRVKAHNKQVKAQGGKEKEQIPRWYTTYTEGYFHGQALAENEHVTVVEGPFDALACLAAGINDVVAAGRNGIDSNHIPVTVCYATIAFDADDKGKGGAADSEKTFRRKGIKTDQRTSPDDGLGGDWSERYRRAGINGLAPLLNRCEQEEGSYDRCADCGTSMADEEREFFYNEEGICYCERCRSGEPPTPEPATPIQDQSEGGLNQPTLSIVSNLSRDEIIDRFKAALPGWTVEQLPQGETFETLVAQARAQEAARSSDPIALRRRAMMADLIAFEQEIAKPAPATKYEKEQMQKGVWTAEDMLRESLDNIDWIKKQPAKVWTMPTKWIFGRWERLEKLGVKLHAGISTQDIQASIQACFNKHNHLVLAWSWLRPGTHEYIDRVKRIGLAGVKEEQQRFIAGYDVAGKHYCTLCYGSVKVAG